jgi:hypothetical protein
VLKCNRTKKWNATCQGFALFILFNVEHIVSVEYDEWTSRRTRHLDIYLFAWITNNTTIVKHVSMLTFYWQYYRSNRCAYVFLRHWSIRNNTKKKKTHWQCYVRHCHCERLTRCITSEFFVISSCIRSSLITVTCSICCRTVNRCSLVDRSRILTTRTDEAPSPPNTRSASASYETTNTRRMRKSTASCASLSLILVVSIKRSTFNSMLINERTYRFCVRKSIRHFNGKVSRWTLRACTVNSCEHLKQIDNLRMSR